jgi:predicted nucleic acid-binding protein
VAYKVVLDANVLFGFALCDTFLRLSDKELFDIVWSDEILQETGRNLIERRGLTQQQVDRRLAAMRATFEDADQDEKAIAALTPVLTNDPKDRHVLAAAIVSGAEGIVSFDDDGFTAGALDPYDKQLHHPDEFLCTVLEMHEALTVETIREQAAALRRPRQSEQEVLGALQLAGVPRFVAELRRLPGLAAMSDAEVIEERARRGLPVPDATNPG